MEYNYINCRRVAERVGTTFNFFIGGRGTGKTYGVLTDQRQSIINGEDGQLLFMRLTQKESDAASTEEDNPYRKINTNLGLNVIFESIPKTDAYRIVDKTDSENDFVLGEGRSLVSFHNLRGVDFSHITEIYFDEFIPTESVRKTPEIKQAGYLFAHAYETINRNRELDGQPPVRVYFTANAFSLDSSILSWFGLIDIIQNMQRREQHKYTDRERSIYVELVDRPDIAEAKKKTALYKATSNKQFLDLAINNRFNDTAISATQRNVKLIEYRPIFCYAGQITLYEHKSTGAWYIARKCENAKENYSRSLRGRLLSRWGVAIRMAMQDRRITFDSADTYYYTEHVFDKTNKSI